MGSARSTKARFIRRSTLTRSMSGAAHAGCAWAAATADASAAEHRVISFTRSPEYGERTSNVLRLNTTAHR